MQGIFSRVTEQLLQFRVQILLLFYLYSCSHLSLVVHTIKLRTELGQSELNNSVYYEDTAYATVMSVLH